MAINDTVLSNIVRGQRGPEAEPTPLAASKPFAPPHQPLDINITMPPQQAPAQPSGATPEEVKRAIDEAIARERAEREAVERTRAELNEQSRASDAEIARLQQALRDREKNQTPTYIPRDGWWHSRLVPTSISLILLLAGCYAVSRTDAGQEVLSDAGCKLDDTRGGCTSDETASQDSPVFPNSQQSSPATETTVVFDAPIPPRSPNNTIPERSPTVTVPPPTTTPRPAPEDRTDSPVCPPWGGGEAAPGCYYPEDQQVYFRSPGEIDDSIGYQQSELTTRGIGLLLNEVEAGILIPDPSLQDAGAMLSWNVDQVDASGQLYAVTLRLDLTPMETDDTEKLYATDQTLGEYLNNPDITDTDLYNFLTINGIVPGDTNTLYVEIYGKSGAILRDLTKTNSGGIQG